MTEKGDIVFSSSGSEITLKRKETPFATKFPKSTASPFPYWKRSLTVAPLF
jgi:hypothetical protein